MTTRIRMRIGDAELEAEGEKSFLLDELPPLLTSLGKQLTDLNTSSISHGHVKIQGRDPLAHIGGHSSQLTTGTIAARISASTGPDLTLAACAKLTISDGLEMFSRSQILEAMRSAAAYFRESYSGNFTKNLNRLVKDGKLNEVGSDRYALTAAARLGIEPKLK